MQELERRVGGLETRIDNVKVFNNSKLNLTLFPSDSYNVITNISTTGGTSSSIQNLGTGNVLSNIG